MSPVTWLHSSFVIGIGRNCLRIPADGSKCLPASVVDDVLVAEEVESAKD